jgi:tetratricopeptide (TPR) repeat protein
MTMESSSASERRFTRDGLPWAVGAAALVAYLATLNHWVTLNNLALVGSVSGWDWQPALAQPLLFLVTCPFRLLPTSWVPLALNAFTAGCAALTLVTLARSVALLPHDRTEDQRLLVNNEQALLSLPMAWAPVVLAAVALGLQMTFWEHAIAASGEMLDLLVFAYVIRCLLEYRLHEQPSWLDRATFVFGVALANNWGMFGFLPLFLIALVWTKRFGFFNLRSLRRIEQSGWERAKPALAADLRFFVRTALLGLAGLSLFLLLPLLQSLLPHSSLSFWQALREPVVAYDATLRALYRGFFRYHRDLTLLLAACSLLPILLLSIRWGALGSGQRESRFDLAAVILYVSHAFLLSLCLWVVFDPPFSPRQVARRTGLPLPFLPLYYLTALSLGYYSGFFLLVFGPGALQRLSRRHTLRRALYPMAPGLVCVLPGLALAGLLVVNLPVIRAVNAPHLDRYARLAAGSLPAEGAVVLGDDPVRLKLLRAALTREGTTGRYLPVETRSLSLPKYSAWLSRRYPGRWPGPGTDAGSATVAPAASRTNAPLDAVGIVRLVARVGESNRLYCLQPGVGPLLNHFYLQPHGLLHEMKPYPPERLSAPPLTAAELAENQTFWRSAIETAVRPVLQLASLPQVPRPDFEKRLMQAARLQTPPPPAAKLLAGWYSAELNRWGVTLQRNERWPEAAACFELAQELKPDNLPARVNWQCNSNLLAHRKMTVAPAAALADQLGNYRNLPQLLAENGPFDDPGFCYHLGLGFASGGLVRQACQQFERVKELVPDNLPARLMLGEVLNNASLPDMALQVVSEIKADPNLQPLGLTNEVEVALLEARAWYAKTNPPVAEGIIYALLAVHPREATVLDRAVATLMAGGSYTEAMRLINRRLQANPDDAAALATKGNLCILMGQFSNAIPAFTRSLSLTNSYGVRLNRALAYLRAGQPDAAQADCQALLEAFPASYRAYFGLGEIALARKDTNAAMRYYEQYLAKAEPNTDEARRVAARLQSLQPSRR